MKIIQKIALITILLLAIIFRFYQLGEIPTGIHADEASQGYNAFSLLKTGKDMYGKSFPILFRSNGSYQPPVYTYLTIISVYFFGNTVFSARFISAVAGSLLVLLTFLIVSKFGIGKDQEKVTQGLFASLVVAISPWGIHFSRLAIEANLVSFIDASAVFFLLLSLKRKWLFIIACFLLGISTHTYYTERITSFLLLGLFLYVFRKIYLQRKKETALGILVFLIVLLPHLYILSSGALTRRLSQVSYLSDTHLLKGSVFSKFNVVDGQFLDHYFYHFSLKNLFIDPGQESGRVDPEMGMFYPWFLLPLVFGIGYLARNKASPLVKLLIFIIFIGPVPAGLTGDLFSPLRIQFFLWAVSMVVSFGGYKIWMLIKYKALKVFLLLGVVSYSIFTFYISYFGVSRYLEVNDFGYSYIKLMSILPKYKDQQVIIDKSPRSWGAGIRLAYLQSADPAKIQAMLRPQMETPYYSNYVNSNEVFRLGNITVEPINWRVICGKNLIVVGDRYSISSEQMAAHNLVQEFTVDDMTHNPILFAYRPTVECQ